MQKVTLWWLIGSLAWLARGLDEWWCWLLGMSGIWWCWVLGTSGIWQHQPGLASPGRSYSLGRTADSWEATCGLTVLVSVIVCKYCRAWDPTDLRILGISRVCLFVPRIAALVIITAEWQWGASLVFPWELFAIVQSRWGCHDVCLEKNSPRNMLNVWMSCWDCLSTWELGLWRASNVSQKSLSVVWWVKLWLGCKGKYLKV